MTFPTLMTFILLPELPKGSEEFPSLQQYNLGIGKGEGKVEGVKGMSGAANLPTPHQLSHPRPPAQP